MSFTSSSKSKEDGIAAAPPSMNNDLTYDPLSTPLQSLSFDQNGIPSSQSQSTSNPISIALSTRKTTTSSTFLQAERDSVTPILKGETEFAVAKGKVLDKFEVFEAWLRANGGEFDMLEMRAYEGETDTTSDTDSDNDESEMRGVHAKHVIPPNTTCIKIPLPCLITVEMGKATSIGSLILSSNIQLDAPKHVYLMIFILIDRLNPDSFFKPYYDILPPTLSNMPIFWSTSDLSLLKGSYLLTQIQERKDAIEEDYKSILEIAPDTSDVHGITLHQFAYARMLVCSRNFGLLINGVRTSALVPHADMLNHFRPRETKWTFSPSLQAFTITTLRTIDAGRQIYDSYGMKCNHRFLLNYGFCVEDNVEFGSGDGKEGICPNEVVFELSCDDNRHDANVVSFWVNEGSSSSSSNNGGGGGLEDGNVRRVRVSVSNNDNTKTLLSLMRVMTLNEDEMNNVTKEGNYMYRTPRDIRFPLNLDSEKRALKELKATCIAMLSMYANTMEEDQRILALSEMEGGLKNFSNERNACIQVLGEKVVLHHYVSFADAGSELLSIRLNESENENGGLDEFSSSSSDEDLKFEAALERILGEVGTCTGQYCRDVVGGCRREEKKRREREVMNFKSKSRRNGNGKVEDKEGGEYYDSDGGINDVC